MSNRLIKTDDDIFYHLRRETGFSDKVLRLVVKEFWNSVIKEMLNPFSDKEKLIMTGFVTFHKSPIRVLKMLYKKKKLTECLKTLKNKEEILNQINKKINEVESTETV
jgi:hypothetical protein